MSTLDPTADAVPTADDDASAGAADRGPSAASRLVDALTSSDHKVIGRLLVLAAVGVAASVGVLGVLLGAARIDSDGSFLGRAAAGNLFATFRIGLVFGVLAPLALGLSVIVVPLQLGARSLAFPRLAAAGGWTWLAGVALSVAALIGGGGPAGDDGRMVRLYVAASALIVVGLAAIATTVATTVLTTRAPGMRLSRVPLFSWSALVGALASVLALPVSLAVIIYLYMDVTYADTGTGTSLFGGQAATADWSLWILTGPSLALFAVLAVGVAAELIPVVTRRRLPTRGVALGGLALVGTGVLAAVGQLRVAVLPGTGPAVSRDNFLTKFGELAGWGIFMLLPVLGVVIVLGLGASLARPPSRAARRAGDTSPAPRLIAPFAFAFTGVGIVVAGLLASAIGGIEDLGLIGTVFEEGATVAVVYGSALALLGGVVYWSPKWTGRKPASVQLYGLAALGALGAVLSAAPHLIAGFTDQPAFAVTYGNDGPGALWNGAAMLGHATFVLAVLGVVAVVFKPASASDEAAGDDPWDGHTAEWATTSPAPAHNFDDVPVVRSPEPLLDAKLAEPEPARSGGDAE